MPHLLAKFYQKTIRTWGFLILDFLHAYLQFIQVKLSI